MTIVETSYGKLWQYYHSLNNTNLRWMKTVIWKSIMTELKYASEHNRTGTSTGEISKISNRWCLDKKTWQLQPY